MADAKLSTQVATKAKIFFVNLSRYKRKYVTASDDDDLQALNWLAGLLQDTLWVVAVQST